VENFLNLEINSYGFSMDTAFFYISFGWNGIFIILTILLIIKLKKFLKGKKFLNIKVWRKK
jgi:hypothetical protein